MKFRMPKILKFKRKNTLSEYSSDYSSYNLDDWESYYTTSNKKSSRNKRKKRILPTFYRVVVALAILLVVLTVRETTHPVGVQAREGLKYMLTTEWNFQPAVDKAVQLGLQAVNMQMPFQNDLSGVSPVLSTQVNKDYAVPVNGKVVKKYGWEEDPEIGIERFNTGIAINCPPGSNVKASRDGRVARIGEDESLGVFVLIDHGEDSFTMYAGLGEVLVEENQLVEREMVIGRVSEERANAGTGVHFEIRENDKLVDPLSRLQGIKN